MPEIGTFALLLALVTAGWSALASFNGWLSASGPLVRSGERAMYATWGLVLGAACLLEALIFTDRFDMEYVASYSNRALPAVYKIAALWAGQAGSLLFWLLILCSYGAVILVLNRRRNRPLMPVVTTTIAVTAFFFLLLVNFMARPFVGLAHPPADGQGMNPQLQNPFMAIHPPCLYLGYVGLTVPFAFALAALATGRLSDSWFRTTRRFTIISWFILGTGILLGGWWAYVELGWGGYWAWDPVENASLIPWLTATAFLHSVMIEERKKMLRVWNMTLVIVTFLLSVLGTFITRSGVISSVHSFTKSEIGPMFAGFLGIATIISVALLLHRLPMLQSEHRLDSFVSRESSFLFNNLLLVGAAFAVLWGTLFPILSEAVRGVKITVGPPFFNEIMVPLTLAILTLAGICPIIAWRRATPDRLLRKLRLPLAATVLLTIGLLVAGMRDVYALVSFSLCGFVAFTTLVEFAAGTRARRSATGEAWGQAFVRLVDRNKRRFGGFIVHLAVVLILVGITGSSVFKKEQVASLKRGESFSIGHFTLTLEEMVSHDTPNHEFLGARLQVASAGRTVGTLLPGQNFYKAGQNPSSEVDIRSTLTEDLYLILTGFDPQEGRATVKAYLNPLVAWIWIGGAVLILGSWLAILPDLRERRHAAEARLRAVESYAH